MNIFYSWQSDLERKSNNYLIKAILKKIVSGINLKIEEPIRLDHDTKNLTGSPEIKTNLFHKIDNAKIFIADVSIINKDVEFRPTSNPNVLVELGYAVNRIGWDRILLLFNEHYGNELELPFDIRGHRLIKYNIKPSENKDQSKISNLRGQLNSYIKAILFDIEEERKIEIKQIEEEEKKKNKLKEEKISGKVNFKEVVDGGDDYRCYLLFNLFFVNKTSNNLNNLMFDLYVNGTKFDDLCQKINGVFYFGKPINIDYELPINDISKNIEFKLVYGSDEIVLKERIFELKIDERWESKAYGNAIGSERVFHITTYGTIDDY